MDIRAKLAKILLRQAYTNGKLAGKAGRQVPGRFRREFISNKLKNAVKVIQYKYCLDFDGIFIF